MIPHIPPGRRDRKSSFSDLVDYVADELGDDKEQGAKEDEIFSDVSNYVVADGAGEEGEKTIGLQIGNLQSLRTASFEMSQTAGRALQVDEPVFHYILSWPEHEKPTNEQVFKAAKYTIDALGCAEHQYIVAIHGNTDNLHCHVVLNRINPVTFKAHHMEWSYKTLHKACRELEIENNWSHDPGLYSVVETSDGKKIVVETKKEAAFDLSVSPKAAKFEAWSGQDSFERWAKTAVDANEVKRLLAKPDCDWQQIHQFFEQRDLAMTMVSAGNCRLTSIQDPAASIAASKVSRLLSGTALSQKLGPYQPRTVSAAKPQLQTPTAPVSKRDPNARRDKRLERAAARDALFDDYKKSKTEIKKVIGTVFKPAENKIRQHYDEQKRLLRDRRTALRADIKTGVKENRAAHYSIVRFMYLQELQSLNTQMAGELDELRKRKPKVQTWREFVEDKAAAGDDRAISALKGMVYQDQRNDAKKKKLYESEQQYQRGFLAQPAGAGNSDPHTQAIPKMVWKIVGTGNVSYQYKTGQKVFTDKGRNINFEKSAVTDQELDLILKYAKEKWNGTIVIRGGDDVFRKRLEDKAAALKIKVVKEPTPRTQSKSEKTR